MNNFSKFAANPRGFTIKKWLFEILKQKAIPHEAVIERVATALVTDKDMQDFGKLISDVFEVAYMKAVNDYRKEFEKFGVKINVVAEQPHPEKSGLMSEEMHEQM